MFGEHRHCRSIKRKEGVVPSFPLGLFPSSPMDRAQQVETMFGHKAMGSDSFWAAAKTLDAKEWARLVRRAELIEEKLGDMALGMNSLWAGSGLPSARPPTASGSARSAASPSQ